MCIICFSSDNKRFTFDVPCNCNRWCFRQDILINSFKLRVTFSCAWRVFEWNADKYCNFSYYLCVPKLWCLPMYLWGHVFHLFVYRHVTSCHFSAMLSLLYSRRTSLVAFPSGSTEALNATSWLGLGSTWHPCVVFLVADMWKFFTSYEKCSLIVSSILSNGCVVILHAHSSQFPDQHK